MRLTGLVDIAPQGATFNDSNSRFGIHRDAAHKRQVDHHAFVADCVARYIVAAATDCYGQIPRHSQRYGRYHVIHALAARNKRRAPVDHGVPDPSRSEEHTSELQSLMRISYAVFCLKKKKHQLDNYTTIN